MDEALELQQLLSKHDVVFALTHNYTGYPMVQEARQRIANGELGELRVLQVEYAQDWLSQDLESTGHKQAAWRTDPERSGEGGCLGDIGTHAFNLLEFVSNLQVSQVSADLSTFVQGRRVDDNVQVMLRLGERTKGALWASQVAPGNENSLKLRVYGSKGGLQWSQEDPNYLKFSAFGDAPQTITRGSASLSEQAQRLVRIPAGHPEGYLEAFANIYRDTADMLIAKINGQTPPTTSLWVPDINSGLSGMRFINAVLRSSRNNSAWTELP